MLLAPKPRRILPSLSAFSDAYDDEYNPPMTCVNPSGPDTCSVLSFQLKCSGLADVSTTVFAVDSDETVSRPHNPAPHPHPAEPKQEETREFYAKALRSSKLQELVECSYGSSLSMARTV
mmetsp:Transcript_9353/g.14106  ORF Transcript_9353/g.14106 Transcript_9353/m.14106 type:complete len:120 (+) Transcript_9353:141-500(+)